MKKQKIKPTRSKLCVLKQLCKFIPRSEVKRIARETGAEDKARTFSPWSHVVSLGYAQLTHSIGLNDVCDALQFNRIPIDPPLDAGIVDLGALIGQIVRIGVRIERAAR